MNYNLYIETSFITYNILKVSDEQLQKIVTAYNYGKDKVTIKGEKYILLNLLKINIFTIDEKTDFNKFLAYCKENKLIEHGFRNSYILPKYLEKVGKDVTYEYIRDNEFGYLEESGTISLSNENGYVNKSRINELKSLTKTDFDLTKLIRCCEELNLCSKNECLFSIVMLVRAIIDHIPPIFQKISFNEVANNHGTKSFKESMSHLNNSLRKIADSNLHTHIRNKENLPNKTQVNFSQDLDVLLGEICRIFKNDNFEGYQKK